MYKPSWPKELDDAGWLATYVVGGFGIGLMILVIWWKNEMPSLGDWGDFLGGIFAAIGFIWLIVAHVNSQRRIEEGQKDLENQLAFTQEAVTSLVRLAMSAQLQDAATMANMHPVFVKQNSSGTVLRTELASIRPVSWDVSFRNQGEGVKLTNIEPRTAEVQVDIQNLGACPNGAMFIIQLRAAKPIREFGSITCRLRYQDKIQRGGYADISVGFPNGDVDVQYHMGEPPAALEPEPTV